MYSDLFVVILAGGSGERLWPLSRKNKPKQLLQFGNNSTLIEHTIDRFASVVDKQQLCVVTTQHQAPLITEHVGHKVGAVLAEPVSRNTAPAILYSCLTIAQQNPNARIAFVPADHFIVEQDDFIQSFSSAVDCALLNDGLVLLGVKPHSPAVGYGYIEYNDQVNNSVVKKVKHFHEKPSYNQACHYIQNPHMLWNIGIFCARIQVYLDAYRFYAPELFARVHGYFEGKNMYEEVASISFDHAVVEKIETCYVVPGFFTWSDVGNVTTFLTLQEQFQGNHAQVFGINAHNNLLRVSKKLVAFIGIDNVCVIETDDVLLVAHRDQVDCVKNIVTDLKEKHYEDYL